MNKPRLTLLLTLLTIFATHGQGFNYTKDYKRISQEALDPTKANFYDTLKSRFLRDDQTLTHADLVALQIGFSLREEYKPYASIDLDRAFLGSASREDTDTTIWFGTEYLKINPVSLSANYALWKAYEKTNQRELAARYQARFNRLIESDLSTGDGSIQKPYFVLSPIDGQILIRTYWNARIGIMGSSTDKRKNFLDMLEMQNPDGTTRTLYFVIEHAVKKMF